LKLRAQTTNPPSVAATRALLSGGEMAYLTTCRRPYRSVLARGQGQAHAHKKAATHTQPLLELPRSQVFSHHLSGQGYPGRQTQNQST